MQPPIRPALPDDAAAFVAIVSPIIANTTISFELDPPSVEAMRDRITETLRRYPWLASLDEQGRVSGYAYAGPHRPAPAYGWSVNTSIYLREDGRGRGRQGAVSIAARTPVGAGLLAGIRRHRPSERRQCRLARVRGFSAHRHLSPGRVQARSLAGRRLVAARPSWGRLGRAAAPRDWRLSGPTTAIRTKRPSPPWLTSAPPDPPRASDRDRSEGSR